LRNVFLFGLSFRRNGQPLVAPAVFIGFIRIDDVRVDGCSFSEYRFMLVGFFGCRRVRLTQCDLRAYGLFREQVPNAPAVHIAGNGPDPSSDIEISRNDDHDRGWVAIQIFGDNLRVIENRITGSPQKRCALSRETAIRYPGGDAAGLGERTIVLWS
jgi:hypothetical protein